jgi:hypothetical protein
MGASALCRLEQRFGAAFSIFDRGRSRGRPIEDQGLLSGADNNDFDREHVSGAENNMVVPRRPLAVMHDAAALEAELVDIAASAVWSMAPPNVPVTPN